MYHNHVYVPYIYIVLRKSTIENVVISRVGVMLTVFKVKAIYIVMLQSKNVI